MYLFFLESIEERWSWIVMPTDGAICNLNRIKAGRSDERSAVRKLCTRNKRTIVLLQSNSLKWPSLPEEITHTRLISDMDVLYQIIEIKCIISTVLGFILHTILAITSRSTTKCCVLARACHHFLRFLRTSQPIVGRYARDRHDSSTRRKNQQQQQNYKINKGRESEASGSEICGGHLISIECVLYYQFRQITRNRLLYYYCIVFFMVMVTIGDSTWANEIIVRLYTHNCTIWGFRMGNAKKTRHKQQTVLPASWKFAFMERLTPKLVANGPQYIKQQIHLANIFPFHVVHETIL